MKKRKRRPEILKTISKYPKLLSPRKNTIIKLVHRKSGVNINQIHKITGISYKETFRHVEGLVKAGVFTKKKNPHLKNRPNNIKLKK